jgi:hypothetical protein
LDSVSLISEGISLFKLFEEPDHALVGFNSIGGFSTINHLHYQLFDVRAMSITAPVEHSDLTTASCKHKYYSELVKAANKCTVSDKQLNVKFGTHSNEGRLFEAFTLSFEDIKLSLMDSDQI